jgi:hypothetical protein
MSEKAFASLTAGLLARKGAAKPAMRPQLYDPNADLGFNDMGEASAPSPAPPQRAAPVPIAFGAPVNDEPRAEPPVVKQQAALAQTFAEPAPPRPRAAPGSKGKSAFTLRLDAERHLKLRLVGARKHRSAQSLVTEALDRFLAEHEAELR